MASVNKIFLIGNLTRDPELRYTPKGTPVCDIAIAVNRNYTGEDGSKSQETTFVDVTLWSRLAEVANEHLRKGRPVFIEGRLSQETWTDQSGNKRTKLKVVAENLQFLGSREGEATPSGAPRSQAPSSAPRQAAAQPRQQSQPTDEPDDIPFFTTVYRDIVRSRLNRRIL